jgi:hypothetical protein
MSACSNCGIKMGCSCQRRTASDGKSVCSSCVINYEEQLKNGTSTTEEVVTDEYNNLKKFTNTLDIT